VTENKQKAQC